MNDKTETPPGGAGRILRFTVTDADFAVINRARRRRIWRPLREVIFWAVVAVNVLFSVLFISEALRRGDALDWSTWTNGAFALLLVFWRYMILPWNAQRYSRRQGYVGKAAEAALDDEGLVFKIDGVVSTATWASVLRAERTKTHLLVWLNDIQAFFFPFRAFETEQECENAWQLILKKTAKMNEQ